MDYKFNERELILELKYYINDTYGEHYASDKYQATDVIIDSGHGEGFCMGNIMKYAKRYGNKAGKNRKDLAKAPTLKSVWKKFCTFVDKYNWKKDPFFNPIPVGFNIIGFDMIIINRLCKEYGPFDDARQQQKIFSKIHIQVHYLLSINPDITDYHFTYVFKWSNFGTSKYPEGL